MTGRAAELLEQAEARAKESLEWNRDFEQGMFHIRCHACGKGQPYLPTEFFGLVQSDAQAARDVLELAASLRLALTVVEAAQDWAVRRTNDIAGQHQVNVRLQAALAAFERAGTDTNNEAAE